MRPTVKLWELYDITSSKRVFEKDWKKSWVPFYRAREIVKLSEDWFVDNELFISEEMYKEYWEKYWLPKKNDIMVTWVWTIWICYLVKENDKFYYKDWNILWFKNKWKEIESHYVEYFFKTDYLKNQIQSFGSVVQTLTIQKAKEVEIPLPPLETQKAIVAKLDQIFAELDQTKSEIQKNMDNADELWKSSLNQAFQGDWEMKTIEELTTSIEYWIWETWLDKWDLRYVRITDIDEDCLLKDYDKKYIMLNEKSKLSLLKKWDVLIARTWATFGKCLYFDSDEQSAFAWYLIRPNFKKEVNTKYFSLFAQSWLYWNQANNLVSWWWQPQFNANAIKKIKFIVPPLSEQEKIVEHLDQVSKEVKALKFQYQSQLDNLEELKKSVLDKAFRWEL